MNGVTARPLIYINVRAVQSAMVGVRAETPLRDKGRLEMLSKFSAITTIFFGAVSILGTQHEAQADTSCTPLLAALLGSERIYAIELTMHREDVPFVSYSYGTLQPAAGGSFSGTATQTFSDHRANTQQFDVNKSDKLDLFMNSTGLLRIHYSPDNFDTIWDLSCRGKLLTTYLPNYGVVTLRLDVLNK